MEASARCVDSVVVACNWPPHTRRPRAAMDVRAIRATCRTPPLLCLFVCPFPSRAIWFLSLAPMPGVPPLCPRPAPLIVNPLPLSMSPVSPVGASADRKYKCMAAEPARPPSGVRGGLSPFEPRPWHIQEARVVQCQIAPSPARHSPRLPKVRLSKWPMAGGSDSTKATAV